MNTKGVRKLNLSEDICAGDQTANSQWVAVPRLVLDLAERLGRASQMWICAATVDVLADERAALRWLRDELLAAEMRARKKSPDDSFPEGTPSWAQPRSLEQVLGAVTGRHPNRIAVCADSRRKPPHRRAPRPRYGTADGDDDE